MKSTKERILESALELFNSKGLGNTSLRTIAQHAGMSQGNLNYHFKLREEIVEALYFDLVNKMNDKIGALVNATSLLGMMYEISLRTMNQMVEYRFIFRDFYQIMREQKTINSHYQQLTKLRSDQFGSIFSDLIKNETIREEEFIDEYVHLLKRMTICADNWINTLETFDIEEDLNKQIKYYAKLLFESIYPYLTEKGKLTWNQIEF